MNQIWFGDQHSFDSHADKYRAVCERFGSAELMRRARKRAKLDNGYGPDSEDDDEDECPNPVGYEVMGNVAVLTVKGGTEDKSSWITRFLGICTYQDIRERMLEASEDGNAASLLLSLDTSGGIATGAFPLCEFIALYTNRIKPIISFTDTSVASAGVLYGTAASAMFADPYAEVGSIGAVAKFADMTGYFKQLGIVNTVFRSAPYKAVPNRYEPLDAKVREILQGEVDKWHIRFVNQLNVNLGISVDAINKNIANGKMYDAPDALSLGLVQGLTTFEKLVATMNAKYQTINASAARPNYN